MRETGAKTVETGAKFSAQRTLQTLPAILSFTAIAYKRNRTVAINETYTLILCLQVERALSKMLCAVDYIFILLRAFNSLQPMKKFVFSVASRATGRLQIKPSGSGDENELNNVCACAETGQVWDLNLYRLQRDFQNILTFSRFFRWILNI